MIAVFVIAGLLFLYIGACVAAVIIGTISGLGGGLGSALRRSEEIE